MPLRQYTDPLAFAELQPGWNSLLERSRTNVPFLTWEWQSTWWKHLGEGELALLAVDSDAGEWVGIAPLCRVRDSNGDGVYRWVGCVDVSDYLDVVVLPGHEETAYTAILDYLLDPDTPRWSAVDLCSIPQASPTLEWLPRLAQERGLFVSSEVQEVCPVIPLPRSFDEYLASVDKKQRHEIRRKLGRAEREAITRWSVARDDLDSALDMFIALHAKSAPDKNEFMTDRMQAFFRAISHTFQQQGWLQLVTLEMDGRPAASMLNFDYGADIMVYNSGYDPQEHAWLSPGIVLLAECIRHAIELGRSRFDFLRGGEEYKYRFGAQKTTVHRLLISREHL